MAFATVIVKLFVVFAEELESVTVTATLDDPVVVGVPEITPVEELIANPFGKVPVTVKTFVPLPPVVAMFSV